MRDIVLIKVSGRDRPGLTAALATILGRYGINVLDIGQAVIHNNLAWGMLVEIPPEAAAAPVFRELMFKAHELDLDRLTVQRHRLLPDPECPACATPPTDRSRPLRLGPAPKPAPHVFRTKPLLDQDLPVDALANPVCGAVGAVVVTDLSAVTTAATAGSS